MKTENEEAALFRAECERWQKEMGLLHWTLQFKTEKATQGAGHEAETDFDCETRHAVITYNVGVEDALHPTDVALHEMLHLLFADMVIAALGVRGGPDAESDPTLAREEHKVIEVLLKIIPRKIK